jgi:two-component system, cell cycle sensor histidine kinase and response regulator CckA
MADVKLFIGSSGSSIPVADLIANRLERMGDLFLNASEAIGDRNGVVRVITGQLTVAADSKLVTSGRLAERDYVTIEISDNGRSMTAELQLRVFDAFVTTKTTGSHGLGLATVKGIVERLHGTILLSSAPDEGATFQIFLPCAKPADNATQRTVGVPVMGTRTTEAGSGN